MNPAQVLSTLTDTVSSAIWQPEGARGTGTLWRP
jgi:hypothetical protein